MPLYPPASSGGGVTLAEVIDTLYPIGSIYISTLATNPGTLLGRGTWAVFGAGRVLVGINSVDADFDTLEETGGEKTHVLTVPEMPPHIHAQNAPTSASGGAHKYGIDTNASGNTFSGLLTENATDPLGIELASLLPHNNIQPYIVVAAWKRTG